MALFRPKASSSGGGNSKYTGLCEMGIIGFTDKSSQFDWADIFIEVEVGIKDSEYSRHIRIRGSFDKDEKNNITGGSVLNRIYKFFGDIECTAGVNLKGKWETEDGKAIKDMAKYLNDNHSDKLHSHPYLGYVYKELNKKTQKAYNSVHYRLFPNNSTGKLDLSSHIKWMKTNGYLNEAPANLEAPKNNSEVGLPFSLDEAL